MGTKKASRYTQFNTAHTKACLQDESVGLWGLTSLISPQVVLRERKGKRQVLGIPLILAQQHQAAVQLSIQRGQVIHIQAAPQQLLQGRRAPTAALR